MLNLTYLATFRHLVEIKSFTRTAQKLAMTQPGVSQHLRALEQYFGDKLIQNSGKKFVVTDKGMEVYNYALHLFKQHESFKQAFKTDDPYTGTCRMASPGAMGIGLYHQLLKINSSYPDLRIHFNYAPNRSIELDLLDDKLDMGFMTVNPISDALETKLLGSEKLLIITPKKKAPKNFKELMELGFINHPDGQDMVNKVFTKNFKSEYKGFEDLKLRGGNNQIGRILEPVSLGLGFTVLPHFAYEAFADKKALSLFPHKLAAQNDIFMVKKRFKGLPSRFDMILQRLSKTWIEKS